jgi:alpha-maltose-1-phosphate synthase
VHRLAADPELAKAYGLAGRQRAIADFGWDAIAEQTMDVYRAAAENRRASG